MKIRLILPGLLACLLMPGPLLAEDIRLSVVDDRGRAFPAHDTDSRRFESSRHAYLEAERGARYGIRVRNNRRHRVGLVIAVDGRNIISGRASNLSRDERMYILAPGEQAEYRGWRTGRDRVNRFYFTRAEDSYAAAWGDHAEIGTIAVAVYPEHHRAYRDDHKYSEGYAPFRESPGTGFGEEDYSPSRRVEFEAARQASSRYFLHYMWREDLCRRGIIRCPRDTPRYQPYREPEGDFAPPPPRSHDNGEPMRRWQR